MALAPGVRLGPYEIVAPLGAGGMGEVYRARDTRLDRSVAIKVLPPELAADPQLRDRFDREARAVSSLNHPHICALYDVGHDSDVDFLVLELLEGQTLAERLSKGPLPVDEALRCAMQICDALDKAHRSGIVHRDLKPANVMLTKSGAKLLDFGLAKAPAPVVATSGLSMLPTTPPTLTAQGTILGTFQYMAPEQIEGLEADPRTDIFALGAVLFEMLTGRPAFEGKTRASLLGAILKDTPPRVSTLQPVAPPALDRVIGTCLEKDPDDRYQSARDLLRDLKWVATTGTPATPTAAASPRRVVRTVAAAVTLAVCGAVTGALALRQFRPVTGTEPIQFTVTAPEGHPFGGPPAGGTGGATQLALSPDGRQLAFVAAEHDTFQIWIRSAAAVAPRLIAGTDGAAFPFWSPDGRHLAFFADGKLKRTAVAGGPPIVLCDAPNARGGTWSRDNVILFGAGSNSEPIRRVSAAGGTPVPASRLDTAYGDTYHRWPSFLPDGRHFVFTAAIGVCCPAPKTAEIRVGTLDSTDVLRLFQVDSAVQYASGHLLYSRDGTLMAQPFDAAALKSTGEAFPVAEHVRVEGSRYASFSASANGVLAYGLGLSESSNRLTWRDRAGRVGESIGEPARLVGMALSPDERRVAVTVRTGNDQDIWIADAQRGTTSRFTFDPGVDLAPVWSPDGSHIVYEAARNGVMGLRLMLASGASNEETLLEERGGIVTPTDWSHDGRYILFERSTTSRQASDIWALPLFGDRKPFAVIATPFVDLAAVFSPDGRWIAYQSNETGSPEVYVQPFPPTGGKYQASKNGGRMPIWSADGKELYYIEPRDDRLMAVAVDGSHAEFEMAAAQALFVSGAAVGGTNREYAVSKDRQRFLINMRGDQATAEPITVVVNWLAAVQK